MAPCMTAHVFLAKGMENGFLLFLDMSIVDIYALPLEVPEETACLTRTIDALDGNGGAKQLTSV